MLLEDLNEDCLEEIFKYLSPMDLINLYKWNKIFLEIPSQTKVFEDFCERLSIIDKKILAKNSVQLHDFGNNICNTALFRFIDNLQCTSNMADILDKLGLKNVPYHRINDVEILIEILQLKDSATSWGSLQIRDNQDLNFYWRKRIGGIDLVGGDGCSVADNPAYVLPSWSDHMYESFFGDYTQWYLQTIFRNWLFAENVPNSILKTFKSKCNLLPTNEGRQISGKINYEKLLHHNQSILEDLKKVLGENEINEECLRFTESPEEYLDNIRLTILDHTKSL
ncbi:hypothetical protein GQR58_014196 [Nymphon striatum]|nr:hypothetical protein GQR58_014196 [Nymphon striatum]